eukprot:9158036-Pyramimonas_sp.AAC.1
MRFSKEKNLLPLGPKEPRGRWAWKTTLAGRYPPRLRRSWAAILARAAPVTARGADATSLERWETDLARAAGCLAPDSAYQPVCP